MKVLPITYLNKNEFDCKKRNTNKMTPVFKAGRDTFVQAEKVAFHTIEDISKYLEINKNKIMNGKIFNEPVSEGGETLLMSLLSIKPLPEEKMAYKSILFDMSQMTEINYDQKDLCGISTLEWIMIKEDSQILTLIKNKELKQDPLLENIYKRITNPNFKTELIKLDIYKPSIYETINEQRALVSTLLSSVDTDIDEALVDKVTIALQNSDEHISNESAYILRKTLQKCTPDDLVYLPDFVNNVKDNTGNIDLEMFSYFFAEKESRNCSLKTIVESITDQKEVVSYMGTAKAFLDKIGIEYVQDKNDGLLILKEFRIYDRHKNEEINLNKLFKCIKAIIGHANFAQNVDELTDFGNLKYLCSDADFCFCNAETTGKIESIGIDIDLGYPKPRKYNYNPNILFTHFDCSNIKSLPHVKYFGGSVFFQHSDVQEIPELEYVTRDVYIDYSPLTKKDFDSVKVGGKIHN